MHQASDVRRARIQVLVMKVPEGTSGHGEGPAQGDACARPRQASEGLQERTPRAVVQAQGCRGGHHRPLRVYKPVPRSLGPIQTASANQTPRETHTHKATPPSLIHTPRKARGRNRSREPQRKGKKAWVLNMQNWTDANVQVYATLLKTKTIERTECTEDSVGRQPGRAERPSNRQGRPGSKDLRPTPRPPPPSRPIATS